MKPQSIMKDFCRSVVSASGASAFYMAERYPILGGAGLELEEVKPLLPEARTSITALFPDEVVE
jgi:hypothetical protein